MADSAALLDLIAGYEPGDATWAPPPTEPFASQAAREPERLRIATTTLPPIDTTLDPACESATADAAELLRSLGHEVEDVSPPWAEVGMLQLFTAVFGAGIALGVGYASVVGGREPTEESVETLTWELYHRSMDASSVAYLMALAQIQRYAREIISFLAPYDALLTPRWRNRPSRSERSTPPPTTRWRLSPARDGSPLTPRSST